LGCCGLSLLAELGCGPVGADTVETSILQRISHFGLGAAAPSRTYMDPPVLVVTNFFLFNISRYFAFFLFLLLKLFIYVPNLWF